MKWSPANEREALNFLEGRALGGRDIPNKLWKSNQNIIFSTQDNVQDAYWKTAYNNPGHVSNATGGDGSIVVYGGRGMDRGVLAHESGHNLGAKSWSGSPAPSPGTAYAKAQLKEPPVTAYGANSPAEDFAEACRLYATDRDAFRRNFPEKFKVIDFMVEGNLPPGGL